MRNVTKFSPDSQREPCMDCAPHCLPYHPSWCHSLRHMMGGANSLSSSLSPISYHSGTDEAMHLNYRQALSQPSSAPPLLLWQPAHMIYSTRVATATSENIFIKIWGLSQNSKNESNSSFVLFCLENQISTGDFSKRVQKLIVRTIISWHNVYVSDKCFYYN